MTTTLMTIEERTKALYDWAATVPGWSVDVRDLENVEESSYICVDRCRDQPNHYFDMYLYCEEGGQDEFDLTGMDSSCDWDVGIFRWDDPDLFAKVKRAVDNCVKKSIAYHEEELTVS